MKAANLAGPGFAFQSNLASAHGSASGAGASDARPGVGGRRCFSGSASVSGARLGLARARGSTSAVAGDSARGSLGSAGAAIGSASPRVGARLGLGGIGGGVLAARPRRRGARGGRFEGVEGGAAGHGGGVWAAESGVGASENSRIVKNKQIVLVSWLKRAMDVGGRWR